MPATVLIVSSGRTGTQFLARYFDRNFDGVVALHEPAPRMSTRLAANAWAAGSVPRALPLAVLRRKMRFIAALDARVYLESNPFLWGLVDLFDEVFDDPTIIHVVRDPREQVRSSLSHGTARGLKGVANRWVPFWYPDVGSLQEVGRESDSLVRAAGLWMLVNQRLREAGTRCKSYHLVRYEDLFDDTHSGLHRVCRLLELEPPGAGAPVDPSVPMNRGGDVVAGWDGWSDAHCLALHRICGAAMREYGYGLEPAWEERIASAMSASDGNEEA